MTLELDVPVAPPPPAAPRPAPPLPASRRLRAAMLTLHGWLGLTIGLVLALTGLTGAMLAFEAEIDRLAVPGLYQARTPGAMLPPGALLDQVARALPGREPTGLIWPPAPGETAQVRLAGGGRAYVDPATGAVQGVREPGHAWALIEDVHRRLLLGEAGSQAVAVGAMAGIALALSGLWLWAPRRGLRRFVWRVPKGAKAAVASREWHAVLGFWVSLGLVIVAWTGIGFTHREVVEGVYAGLTRADLTRFKAPEAPIAADGRRAPLDAVVAAARAAYPQAEVKALNLATKPGRPHRVLLRQPGEWDPTGNTSVFLDPATGTVLRALDPRTAPVAWTLSRLNYAIHTGAIGGWPTKLLVMLVALSPAFFYVTGLILWRTKRRARARG